ncbi:unnamed protein product, partial [marine sediment metagenome]
ISFSGVIFKVSINSYRTATANTEIMQKLRAITDQLNTDFKGVHKGMPIVVWSNRIVFLATGDFQSIGQYGPPAGSKKTVAGNLASIFYGMTPTVAGGQVLSRGQMILTSDYSLPDSNALELGEYFKMPFYEFRAECKNIFGSKETWAGKNLPPLDTASEKDLVRYMTKGVSNFTVEYERWDNIAGKLVWLPGDGTFVDSDHAIQIHKRPGTRALKFTFTLYDSKGIIKQGGKPGRKFTHIVYFGG